VPPKETKVQRTAKAVATKAADAAIMVVDPIANFDTWTPQLTAFIIEARRLVPALSVPTILQDVRFKELDPGAVAGIVLYALLALHAKALVQAAAAVTAVDVDDCPIHATEHCIRSPPVFLPARSAPAHSCPL
jgi:hypothetical protein